MEVFSSFGTLTKVDLQRDPQTGGASGPGHFAHAHAAFSFRPFSSSLGSQPPALHAWPISTLTSLPAVAFVCASDSKGFAFLHFANAEEGRHCVKQMDGFALAGRPIRVNVAGSHADPTLGAPVGSVGPLAGQPVAKTIYGASGSGDQSVSALDGLDDAKVTGGEKLGASQRASLLIKLAEKAGMEVPDETRKVAEQSSGAYSAAAEFSGTESSRCVVLKNMFDRLSDEVTSNPNFFDELAEDVRGECAKLGTVIFCGCDRWSNGFVYVKMLANAEAVRVLELMDGRYFAKQKILASYIPEEQLNKKFKIRSF